MQREIPWGPSISSGLPWTGSEAIVTGNLGFGKYKGRYEKSLDNLLAHLLLVGNRVECKGTDLGIGCKPRKHRNDAACPAKYARHTWIQ